MSQERRTSELSQAMASRSADAESGFDADAVAESTEQSG